MFTNNLKHTSISSIFILISKEFTKLILIANIIAWPVAFYATNRWLQGFAYRTGIDWQVFIFSSFFALAIALLTVSYQAIKAAMNNPVDSLKHE